MLNEDIRILAGLQESQNKIDPLVTFLAENEQQLFEYKHRKLNEHKTVAVNFDTFGNKMKTYHTMIESVMSLFNSTHAKEFINGIFENKYSNLQHFADIVLNDSFVTAMKYLESNYYILKEELISIEKITESIDEENAETYFVSNKIISDDPNHSIRIRLFKNKDLTERISDEILYGSQISLISENFAIVRNAGKKTYTTFTTKQLTVLNEKGFLI